MSDVPHFIAKQSDEYEGCWSVGFYLLDRHETPAFFTHSIYIDPDFDDDSPFAAVFRDKVGDAKTRASRMADMLNRPTN